MMRCYEAGRRLWLVGCCLSMSLVMALAVSCGGGSESGSHDDDSRLLTGGQSQSCPSANANAQQHGDERANQMCNQDPDSGT